MRHLALVFCGEDERAARAVTAQLRNDEWNAHVISAYVFNEKEEEADKVIIMPDVPKWHGDRVAAAYPNAVRREAEKPKEDTIISFKATAGEKVEIVEPIVPPKRRGRPRKAVAV